MNQFKTLLQREWMQHRFGWALMVLIPFGLALLVLTVGQIQLDIDPAERLGEFFPTMLASIALMASMAIVFLILAVTSVILVSGLARRDHGDRSVEFWLSLPTPHASTFAAPLLTHLVIAPVLALVAGAAGGLLVSLVLVGRLVGFSAWAGLPWGDLSAAVAAVMLRLAVGVPLAVLWLMPLILAMVLLGAWLKRWGLPVLLLGVSLVTSGSQYLLGTDWPARALSLIGMQALRSLVHTEKQAFVANSAAEASEGLKQIPGFFLGDIGPALGLLVSPAFIAVLAVSAGLFWLLVDWRRRGAGVAG